MKVNEIFYSIQGEGRYLGVPAVFVRTQGCSAHCPFCDSASTWSESTVDMSIKDILLDVNRARRGDCSLIVVTGGEPTEQEDLYRFAEEALYNGYRCHLETNGSDDIIRGYFDWVVCSPKEAYKFNVPQGIDELKYVIGAGDDINKIIPAGIRDKFRGRIWLQPKANGNNIVQENVQYCLEQVMRDPRLRLGLQYHKMIGVR